MSKNDLQPIDELIESALRSESDQAVPPGFRNRVMERVSAEALESVQATDRTHRFVRPALFMAVLTSAIFVVPMVSFYGHWTRQSLPGGMGLLDYAIAWIDLSRMGSVSDFIFAAVSALIVGAGIFGIGWGFTRLRGSRQQTER